MPLATYNSTPEQIRALVKRIQSEWTPQEELRRRCRSLRPARISGSDRNGVVFDKSDRTESAVA